MYTPFDFVSPRLPRQRGFALVITVVLVAFLVLLVVSLATFTRVETVVSDNSDRTAAARQHALMAANVALAELQLAMGPDQRVSAPAVSTPAEDVLDNTLPAAPSATYNDVSWTNFDTRLNEYWNSSGAQPTRRSPNWVGVWRNNAAFPNYQPRLVNWLISGNERSAVITGASHATPPYRPNDAVTGLSITTSAAYLSPNVKGDPAVVLVGNHSVSSANNPSNPVAGDLNQYVVAPKVDITGQLPDGSNGTVGRYSWWVGDLGAKAALNASTAVSPNYTPAPTGAALEAAVAQSTSRLGFEDIFANFNPNAAWARVVALEQIPFGPTGITAESARGAFHDVGAMSYGLATDTANGGFRVDLTRNPASSPIAATTLANVISAGSVNGNVLSGVELDFVGTGPHTDPDANNQLARTQPFHDIAIGGAQGYLPVVASARFWFGFQTTATDIELRAYPELLLWNPYTADFAWEDVSGGQTYRAGYRYRMRVIYDQTDNSGQTWNAKAQIGILWENTAAPGTFQSTNTEVPLAVGDPVSFFEANTDIAPTSPPLTNVVRRELMAPPPGAQTANSFDGNAVRLRAGELALFRGSTFSRTAAGTSVSLGTAALPPAPFGATSVVENARVFLANNAGASAIEKFVRIEVYARKVDRGGADVDNTPAGTGPHADDKQEILVFRSGPIGLKLGAPRSTTSHATQAAWDAEWIDTSAPLDDGFFPGTDPLCSYSAAGYAADHTAWLGVSAKTPANDDAFWDDISEFDPRVGSVNEVLLGTNNTGSPHVVLSESITPAFGALESARVSNENNFPVLYEAFRVPPTSVGQLVHLPNGTNPNSMLLGLYPDTALPAVVENGITTLNNAAWDGFFFSTLSGSLVAADIDTVRPANTRLQLARVPGKTDAQTLQYLNENGGRPAAAALRVVAPLNVNSPSSKAWASTLSGGGSQNLTVSMWEPTDNKFYNRTDSVGGNAGRFRQAPGITWAARHRELYQAGGVGPEGHQISLFRNGHRSIAPFDARARLTTTPYALGNNNLAMEDRIPSDLANLLVLAGKVQARTRNGPYMSLADFVNSGSLELALSNVPWWETTQNPTSDAPRRGLNWWKAPTGVSWSDFSNRKGAPSYLSQREIMQAIAPVISARSDTFVIRSYGEKLNPADGSQVEGRAWCELVVQRDADYVDSTEDPEDAPATLNPVNERYGRRFRVVSFRWLNAEDI